MSDRDPIDTRAMAEAVRSWLAYNPRGEADIDLEQAMIDQGVMRPDEAVETMEAEAGGVFVRFECGDAIHIDQRGEVTERE